MALAALRLHWACCTTITVLIAVGRAAGQSQPASQGAVVSVEDEVVGNILNQRIGDRTVADDGLPEAFVRRLADRVIRASFQQRYRIVYEDRGSGAGQPGSAPRASTSAPAEGFSVFVHRIAGRELNFWSGLPEARPALRGFRAPIVRFGLEEPFGPLAAGTPEEVQRVADIVSRGLAKEGLLMTTARAMLSFGVGSFTTDTANSCDVLAIAGLPVDLLALFGGDRARERAWLYVARDMGRGLEAGQSLEEVVAEAAKGFRPGRQTDEFVTVTDSGEGVFDTMRLQSTRGDYWGGEGDGGSVDIARQLVTRMPDVEFLISIEQQFAGTLVATARGWSGAGLRRTRLVTEPLTVSQWAQDDGRWGTARLRGAGERKRAILVPRYASRGEDGSVLVPGDSLLLAGLGASGETVLQSALLFQGGNLIVFRLPGPQGRRGMLVGEAEIYRNVALGLSAREALEALRGAFGVDECMVLPAIAYHIDYEVSVRMVNGKLFAFVNDTLAAARMIGACGIEALARKGVLSEPDAARAKDALAAGRYAEFLELAARPVLARVDEAGRFPASLADVFSVGKSDSGVGNLRRFLVACDELAASLPETDDREPGAHAAAYVRSLRRRAAERGRLRTRLAELGMQVVAIPSLSDEEQSINYINGLHDSTRLLMPAYGGLYSRLDEAARAAFSEALGPGVRVLPIYCAESQRRDGAVRCSVSVYTGAPEGKSSGAR